MNYEQCNDKNVNHIKNPDHLSTSGKVFYSSVVSSFHAILKPSPENIPDYQCMTEPPKKDTGLGGGGPQHSQ